MNSLCTKYQVHFNASRQECDDLYPADSSQYPSVYSKQKNTLLSCNIALFLLSNGGVGTFSFYYTVGFFFFLTSLLEYNCFTTVCQFLLYNKVNQLYIYIFIYIPISPPSCVSLPPSLSHPSRQSQSTELISLCYVAASHQLSILHLVVYICPCHSLTELFLTSVRRIPQRKSRPHHTFLSKP